MGKIIHLDKVKELFKRSPVVSITSLKKILGKKSNYIHLLLHNLTKQKEIYRVTKGKYSQYDDPTVAVYCFKPAYLGLQNALSIHNLWEQETNILILTTKIAREGIRQIMESNVILKRIPIKLYFGVEYKQYGDFYVPVSDVEKTFLDLIYFDQVLDKKVVREFKKRIELKKIKKYLRFYPKDVKEKVDKLKILKT